MNLWIVISAVIGVLALATVAVTGIGFVNADSSETIPCKTCEKGCTQSSNCGLSTCGVASGTGNCGCGR